MCSHSQIDISTFTNDVTVADNNFTEAQWTPNNGDNWYNMSSEPNQIYQSQQWIPQTRGLNFNIQQSPQAPNPYFQNVIGGVPASSNIAYQESYRHCISQPYSSNRGYVTAQNPLQFQSLQHMVSGHLIGNRQWFGSSHPKPNRSQTNYVQTKTGLKAVKKRKRKRTMFTTEQVAVLEKVFLSKPYVNREERQALVEELQINDKVIKVWFQNRRLKEKREAEEAEQELYSPDTGDTEANYNFDELTYIESKMHQTDNSGFVTLDDRAINGLVSVIDNLFKVTQLDLSEEKHVDESPTGPQEESKGVTIYEPISPASSENTSCESTSYEPFEPKESLQRIFDIQEFLVFNKNTV